MLQLAEQNFFESFNCDFNCIDEAKLRQLISAEFVQRGENLLIIGEPGSGMTVIANAIEREATLRGLSCVSMRDHDPFATTHFLDTGFDIIADGVTRFHSHWLEPDLLIVEEAHRLLEIAPHEFTFLLGQRIALGKSNILSMPRYGWHRAAKAGTYEPRGDHSAALQILSKIAHETRFRWGEKLTRCQAMSLDLQMQLLGIGLMNWSDPRKKELFDLLDVPATREARTLKEEFDLGLFGWCNQSLTEWMHGPGWKPVWQVLYTGDKNYRRKLEGRI